jgi:hypothetical protein
MQKDSDVLEYIWPIMRVCFTNLVLSLSKYSKYLCSKHVNFSQEQEK